MKNYKIQLTFSSEVERNIIVDVIREHELISTIYSQSTKTEKLDCKYLTVLNETLTDNLYKSLTGRAAAIDY
tara:strand:+ start:99 stop:314 length:216 start_codon:yes stop_codon:yes gene_type:complete